MFRRLIEERQLYGRNQLIKTTFQYQYLDFPRFQGSSWHKQNAQYHYRVGLHSGAPTMATFGHVWDELWLIFDLTEKT